MAFHTKTVSSHVQSGDCPHPCRFPSSRTPGTKVRAKFQARVLDEQKEAAFETFELSMNACRKGVR